MKAQPEIIEHLTLCTQELIQRDPEAVRRYRHQVTYTKDQFISFIWGIYHALPPADRQAIQNNLGDPLLDQHLETALKHVLKDYKDV